MREVAEEFLIKEIVDLALGMVEEDGRANGFPMDRDRPGARRPNPWS